MMPETQAYIATAQRLLSNASRLVDGGFSEDAGRNCYLAGIHDSKLTAFLPMMADLKTIADYETGGGGVSPERAAEAIRSATEFVHSMVAILTAAQGKGVTRP
jgi:uncharacterized protein (UPF0332 family)